MTFLKMSVGAAAETKRLFIYTSKLNAVTLCVVLDSTCAHPLKV